MKEDVKSWCESCEIYQLRRNTGPKTKVTLQPIQIIPKPMEFTALNIMVPLPETIRGNKYILVF